MQNLKLKRKFISLAAAALLAAPGLASALPVTWTDWTSISGTSASGVLDGVSVSVSADIINTSRSQTGCGTNWWTEPDASDRPYTGGTLDTAPTNCEQISLNLPTSVTVSFGSAIDNLYMALLSVGTPSRTVSYDFNESFVIDSEGRGFWGNDGTDGVVSAGDVFSGTEFHGVLSFTSPITSLTFTTAPSEFWHAFTFGKVENVPEPGMLAMFALGLLGLGYSRRRQLA